MSIPNAHASSSKEHQSKHKKSKSKSKDLDGKSKHKHSHRKDKSSSSSSSSANSSFERRSTRMRLSIAPKYALDWLSGVKETLDGMLMRYVPQLDGVLLAHWEHEFCDDTVKIVNECPYGVCEVAFKSMIWAPKVGQKLYGSHSLSSPSHLSLLFARTFNISIPLQHIPQDMYKFEHTDVPEDEADSESEDEDAVHTVEEVGRWRNVTTGKLVGEDGTKGIEFTVIGMQVDNNVLSLTGSLLSDPTNPPPPPSPTLPVRIASPSPSPETDIPRPSKKARPAKATPAAPAPATAGAAEAHAEEIDERFLSARELKKKRKEEEKKKRDARKARKEEREIEGVEQAGAALLVDVEGVETSAGGKRKAKGDDGEGKKKRKVEG